MSILASGKCKMSFTHQPHIDSHSMSRSTICSCPPHESLWESAAPRRTGASIGAPSPQRRHEGWLDRPSEVFGRVDAYSTQILPSHESCHPVTCGKEGDSFKPRGEETLQSSDDRILHV